MHGLEPEPPKTQGSKTLGAPKTKKQWYIVLENDWFTHSLFSYTLILLHITKIRPKNTPLLQITCLKENGRLVSKTFYFYVFIYLSIFDWREKVKSVDKSTEQRKN